MNILENNFEIEDLGVQELEVYDIEVENNHNFFGNDILIHNSGYYTIAPIMKKIIAKDPTADINKLVDFADAFEKKIIDPVIQNSVKIATTKLNARRPEVIGAKREIIADTALYIRKKKYIARVRDSEGTRYPAADPHMKFMGVELARTTTAPYIRDKLKESLNIILDQDYTALKTWIDGVRVGFNNLPLSDLATFCGIKSAEMQEKNTPYIAKGAFYHNLYVKQNNLQSEFMLIEGGTKGRVLPLKSPNPLENLDLKGTHATRGKVDRLVYFDDKLADKFKDYVDYDRCFDDYFVKPLQNMVNALDYNLSKVDLDLEDW